MPYSNWEWGRVVQSESLGAFRLGSQSTLVNLGAVPIYHQTDTSSDACFPTLGFRQAWEFLNTCYPPRQADLIYLRVLHMAAHHLESQVGTILSDLLAQARRWDERDVQATLHPPESQVPPVVRGEVCLAAYDMLLTRGAHDSLS